VACSAQIQMGIHPDSAFLALVNAHEETLLRAARLLTGDWERAEDLLQDTLAWLLSAWERLSREPAAPLRVRQRLVAAYLDSHRPADADDAAAELDEEAPVPPAHRHLVASLADLRPEDRAVLVSRYYLGLSAAEIGEVLGTDAEGVTATAAQALATLRWVR
jgi:RNA polymerase sigma factor (sigma-70 family)